MEKAVKYNGILTNSVILQNVVDMTDIIAELLDEGNKITKEDMATLCPYLTAHLKRFGDIIMDFNGVPKMLIGAEARCYGEQKRIVVIQIIRHRKRQKNLFVISFETGVQF